MSFCPFIKGPCRNDCTLNHANCCAFLCICEKITSVENDVYEMEKNVHGIKIEIGRISDDTDELKNMYRRNNSE